MAAGVVNGLVHAYIKQEAEMRMAGTDEATVRLNQELAELKAQIGRQDAAIAALQERHGLLNTPEMLANGQPSAIQHNAQLTEIEALGRELVAATAERLEREAEYKQALKCDPEAVVAGDPYDLACVCADCRGRKNAPGRAADHRASGARSRPDLAFGRSI